MSHYFITGATGVVGNEIAARLLASPDGRLSLLIRASDDVAAARRVDELVSYWGLDSESVRARIDVLCGDAALPRFGLSAERYRELACSITSIIHCAALVRMNLPLEEAVAASVGSAENIIGLAAAAHAAGQFRKLEFLSTVGVAGRMDGTLPERWIHEPRTFHNTYEQAKAQAEQRVEQALADGLPVTLFRPSMVVGDALTGRVIRFQIFYHLVEFLSGQRTRGVYPALGSARIDLVPVDFVSRVVAWSSGTMETAGRVLHLCSGPAAALPLVELRDIVRARLKAMDEHVPRAITLPPALLRAAIPLARGLVPADARRALGTLPIFLDYLEGEQSFGNEQTQRLLASAGMPVPVPREYVGPVLDYYFARRRRHV